MLSNAWYALANESLDRLARGLKAASPHVQTVSLAYSVWAEVGMGAKLGSVDKLEEMGISSIVPEQGINRFVDSFYHSYGDQQLVITSRMGDMSAKETEENDFRYIGKLVSFHEGVETISKVTLDPETDGYLKDHNYKGTYLFPTVFGLEAMAQAVCFTLGLSDIDEASIENIELTKPITVADHGDDIEVYAEVMERSHNEELRVKTGIRCGKTGYKYDHFSAEYVLTTANLEGASSVDTNLSPIGIDPKIDLYGPILFQGDSFQRIREIYQLESDDENEGMTIFRSAYDGGSDFRMVLGDPYFRDSLLQSAQLIIPKNQCLPVKIGKLHVSSASLNPSTNLRYALSDVHRVDAKSFSATITVTDDQGNVLELMEDYRLQFIERMENNPRALELIDPSKAANMSLQAHIDKNDIDLWDTKLFIGSNHNDVALIENIARHMELDDTEKKLVAAVELGEGVHEINLGQRKLYISLSEHGSERVCTTSWKGVKPINISNNEDEAIKDEELSRLALITQDFESLDSSNPIVRRRLKGMSTLATECGIDLYSSKISVKPHSDCHLDFSIVADDAKLTIASIHVPGTDCRIYSTVISELKDVRSSKSLKVAKRLNRRL